MTREPIPMPNFGGPVPEGGMSFREWIEHPDGYRAGRCFKEAASPPREEWPVDIGALIDRNRELANLHLAAAARYMREVVALTEAAQE